MIVSVKVFVQITINFMQSSSFEQYKQRTAVKIIAFTHGRPIKKPNNSVERTGRECANSAMLIFCSILARKDYFDKTTLV